MADEDVEGGKALAAFLFEEALARRRDEREDDARSAFGGNAARLREKIKRLEYRLGDAIAAIVPVLEQALNSENAPHFKPVKARRYRHLLDTLNSMMPVLALRERPMSAFPDIDIVALLEQLPEWQPLSRSETEAMYRELGEEPPAWLDEEDEEDDATTG